ncbi:MAG: DUF3085 domain-containing protein [Armatimonadetes bacterium]|nr:DUF3085 domain-containing protein [Armatimonadota bacterium]
MKLSFDKALVQQLFGDSQAATEHKVAYEEYLPKEEAERQRKPGLWLVGDSGVYLMSNSKDGVPHPTNTHKGENGEDEPDFLVAYAHEVNPEKLEFEEWWANKRESFGGNDGVEFLDAPTVQAMLDNAQDDKVFLEVSTKSISVPI